MKALPPFWGGGVDLRPDYREGARPRYLRYWMQMRSDEASQRDISVFTSVT